MRLHTLVKLFNEVIRGRHVTRMKVCAMLFWLQAVLYLYKRTRGLLHMQLLAVGGAHAPRKQPRQSFLSQSAVRQSANGVRLISQLSQLELYLMLIAILSQFYLYYGLCIVGAMFKLYLYNITVFNSQFLSCWQSMAYDWSPTQPARVILTCIVPYYYNFVFIIETAKMAQYLNYIFITLPWYCSFIY